MDQVKSDITIGMKDEQNSARITPTFFFSAFTPLSFSR